MYVEVLYYKPETNAYGGQRYTFHTDLLLTEYQKVLVPPDDQKALVVSIVKDEDSILHQPWANRIKSITQIDIG